MGEGGPNEFDDILKTKTQIDAYLQGMEKIKLALKNRNRGLVVDLIVHGTTELPGTQLFAIDGCFEYSWRQPLKEALKHKGLKRDIRRAINLVLRRMGPEPNENLSEKASSMRQRKSNETPITGDKKTFVAAKMKI